MHTWGKFNNELFRKFLDYEDKPKEFKKLIEEVYSRAGLKFDYSKDEIDPISPISSAASYEINQRLEIYTHFAELFNLEDFIPDDDFAGMPTRMSNERRFVDIKKDINYSPYLWKFLKTALDVSDGLVSSESLAKLFDDVCKNVSGVASVTASISLFWIDCENFVTLDRIMRSYLQNQYEYAVGEKFTGDEYLQICNDIKNRLRDWNMDSFLELSSVAWKFSEENKNKTKKDKQQAKVGIMDKKESVKTDNDGFNPVSTPKNLILYGPPGTGKTYQARRMAVEIVAGRSVSSDRFNKFYNRYVSEGKINLVTFHQSFSYEEFVEGIRPVLNPGDTTPTYEICDGVFKTFCKDASNATVKDRYEIKDNAVVWKVSLGGTGDNRIRDDCLKNNRIRMDYSEYGGDLSEYDLPPGLNAFINTMSVGDIVFSCYSETKIDAIGKVTGDYSINESLKEFRKVRSVEWLKKFDEPLDIYELNGKKRMTLSAVYRLSRFSKKDVLSLLGESVITDDSPRVFIIDEINRGNISKIFGELITLIEESKRDGGKDSTESILPYSQERFSIPSSVYIIGTMNTADRSLVNLDTALRRRFSFREMMPIYDQLPEIELDDGRTIDLGKLLTEINRRIEVLYDRDHLIGHSYFWDVHDINDLDYVFEEKVIPLLQEYFFDDYEKIMRVLSIKGRPASSDFVSVRDSRDVFPDIGGMKMYSLGVEKNRPDQYITLYSGVKDSDEDNSL